MKILYAAGNNASAKIQLSRFLTAVQDKTYTIKIAAYKQSSPNVSIDWTLDCLLNIFKPNHISIENENFEIYYEQIKNFAPDLVISDLEYFTSYIANILNISIWQCSSSLTNYALTKRAKYDLGVFKNHAYTFSRNPLQVQRLTNIIENADKKLVYSHYGDMESAPEIKNYCEWIRPYHQIGKVSIPCQHNFVGITPASNKRVIDILKKQSDCVLFTESYAEEYVGLQVKDIKNEEEYFCNLHNSKALVCEGQTGFLADAFYNNKPSVIYTNFYDNECILNGIISEKFNLSTNSVENIKQVSKPQLNENILYLHEQIERSL